MRAWIYYRLSRDEDIELNSLTNQKKIAEDYARNQGYEIVDESFDDNVSGMHFDREGIEKIYDAVYEDSIDAVIVKDLSRLGRHRTQTALFIDFLREHDVRVLSATENIDTFNEDDDLIIGFKQIMNDFYAKDISRKIRAAYKQKQKEGMIIIPPFGYFKDKNTGKIEIVKDAAETVRTIFQMYVEGYGLKLIAKTLNEKGMKSPGYYQEQLIGKKLPYTRPEITHRFLWESTGIKRILKNEIYIGTLICHKSYTSKINKVRKDLPKEEQFRHENFVPAIIPKEIWEQTQFLLKERPTHKFHGAKGRKPYRYTGLISCADCGAALIAKRRRWKNKPERIEYICSGYHRYGKEHCVPHRIDEDTLDKIIYGEILSLKSKVKKNWTIINQLIDEWNQQKVLVEKRIEKLNKRIEGLNSDIEKILMAKINDPDHAERYDSMLDKLDKEIRQHREQIQNCNNSEVISKKKKAEMKQTVDLLEEIIVKNGISDTHLRMLVDKIIIHQNEKGELECQINLRAPYQCHMSIYSELKEVLRINSKVKVDIIDTLRRIGVA